MAQPWLKGVIRDWDVAFKGFRVLEKVATNIMEITENQMEMKMEH